MGHWQLVFFTCFFITSKGVLGLLLFVRINVVGLMEGKFVLDNWDALWGLTVLNLHGRSRLLLGAGFCPHLCTREVTCLGYQRGEGA
eukprot:3695891-Amphidinium_carterae.1